MPCSGKKNSHGTVRRTAEGMAMDEISLLKNVGREKENIGVSELLDIKELPGEAESPGIGQSYKKRKT